MEKKHYNYFITSSGTNIGKTLITCSLIKMLKQKGYDVNAIKPIVSGWNINSRMDTIEIIKSLNLVSTQKLINQISPWRFKAPLSPDIAAHIENKVINFEEVLQFCQNNLNAQYNLIEGIGGIMVPISNKETILDLIKRLNIPIILVIGNYLGSISHSLTALEVIEYHSIKVSSIVFTENEKNTMNSEYIIKTIKNFTSLPIVKIEHNESSQDLFQRHSLLTQIFNTHPYDYK